MSACTNSPRPAAGMMDAAAAPAPSGEELGRTGDEIIATGRLFHSGGAPVVTWLDAGGYDGYSAAPRFSAAPEEGPLAPSFSQRKVDGTPHGPENWTLDELQQVVDQVVIHFDACGSSRRCFEVLHDRRSLSCHFLLDVDGTIYQTLDLKERAWHATSSNDRSIGIEIANIGAQGYRSNGEDLAVDADVFAQWYDQPAGDDPDMLRLSVPREEADSVANLALANAQTVKTVRGICQGQELLQADFTDAQYDSLGRLCATLCAIFPQIRVDYPAADSKLPDGELGRWSGFIGHSHIQTNKVDPGPAFNWPRLRALIQNFAPAQHKL
jgi:N-acetylmuramoyl-L-alanine amidase